MRNILFTIIIASILTACSNFLDDYSQDMSKVETVADLDELLLGDAYLPVGFYDGSNWDVANHGVQTYNMFIHFMSDELMMNKTTDDCSLEDVIDITTLFGYFTWQRQVGINPTGTSIASENECWKKTYKYINNINMVLDELNNIKAVNKQEEEAKIRIEGEAHFLRALYYFTLVNLYADPYAPSKAATTPGIPLKYTSYIEDRDYEVNSVAEVYKKIIEDLEQAEVCLKQTQRVSVYRADLTTAYLLMSRVYLYMQDYKNARKYAEEVLTRNNSLGNLKTFANESGNFLNSSLSEVLFSMGGHMLSTGILGSEYYTRNDQRPFYISDELIAAFDDDNDLRKEHYIQKEGSYYILQKVRWNKTNYSGSKCSVSDNFLFRTAEAYLNLAEAAAMDGDEGKALEVLAQLQSQRFQTPPTINESGNALIELIRKERQRELCLEGHRWYDLRRYNACEKYQPAEPYTYTHSFIDYKKNGSRSYAYRTRVYQLNANDKAYTLAFPREVLNYQNTLSKNERLDREPIEDITVN